MIKQKKDNGEAQKIIDSVQVDPLDLADIDLEKVCAGKVSRINAGKIRGERIATLTLSSKINLPGIRR